MTSADEAAELGSAEFVVLGELLLYGGYGSYWISGDDPGVTVG